MRAGCLIFKGVDVMSLTQCDLNELVAEHINEMIENQLGYEVLRSSILKGQPPEELIIKLQGSLKNLADAEHSATKDQLIREARIAQVKQDQEEAERDTNETLSDADLKTKTQTLVPETRANLDEQGQKLIPLNASFELAKKQFDEQKTRYEELEQERKNQETDLILLQRSLNDTNLQQQNNERLFTQKALEITRIEAETQALEQQRNQAQRELDFLLQQELAAQNQPQTHQHPSSANTHGHPEPEVVSNPSSRVTTSPAPFPARSPAERMLALRNQIERTVSAINGIVLRKQLLQNEVLNIIPAQLQQSREATRAISANISARQERLSALKIKIALSKAELDQYESLLRPIQSAKDQQVSLVVNIQREYDRLNRTLDIDIPQREKARLERLEKRTYRDSNKDSADYTQALSVPNSHYLDLAIQRNYRELDQTRLKKSSDSCDIAKALYIKALIETKKKASTTNDDALALCAIHLAHTKCTAASEQQKQAEQTLAKAKSSLHGTRSLQNEKKRRLEQVQANHRGVMQELDELAIKKTEFEYAHEVHMSFFKGILIAWGTLAAGAAIVGISAWALDLSIAALITFVTTLPTAAFALAVTLAGIAVAGLVLAPIVMGITFAVNCYQNNNNEAAIVSARDQKSAHLTETNELNRAIAGLDQDIETLSLEISKNEDDVREKTATTERLIQQRDAITPENVRENRVSYQELYQNPGSSQIVFFNGEQPVRTSTTITNEQPVSGVSLIRE
jgi:hypothetical protein